ncbi:MAG: hypothetical protein AAGA54_26755 [Myxococcota bacterium]
MSGADAVYRQAYDEVVRLGQDVRQRDHLQASLGAARARVDALQTEVQQRAGVLEREERDVQRLEDVSLARLLWSALGRREEKLSQERAEALAAELELDASVVELRAASAEVARLEAELEPLDGIEAAYHRAFEAKVDRVLQDGGAGADVVRARLETLTAAGELLREIDEALEMGRLCARHLRVALETLDVMQEEQDAAMVVFTTDLAVDGLGVVQRCAARDQPRPGPAVPAAVCAGASGRSRSGLAVGQRPCRSSAQRPRGASRGLEGAVVPGGAPRCTRRSDARRSATADDSSEHRR